jgi:uncharacterized protein (DUF58 family)
MVRKNIVTSEPRLMILLDTRAASYADVGDDAFEDAVRVAASFVTAGIDSRYPVMFRTTSGLLGDISTSGVGRSQVMRMLAEIQPAVDDPGLPAVIQLTSTADGVSLGVVTGRPESSAIAGITRVQNRFDMITVAQVGQFGVVPPPAVRGALVVHGENSEEIASIWRSRFR